MSELRKDPIVDRWVIIAAERGRRPSDFEAAPQQPSSAASCPLCEGNEEKTPPEVFAMREGGPPNTSGWQVRVVPNKFPALAIEGEVRRSGIGLFDQMPGVGAHEVIIESPHHDQDMATVPVEHMARIFAAFTHRICDLRRDERFRHIIVFRNHGTAAGASLTHPHSQVIALPIVPKIVKDKLHSALDRYFHKERCIFCDLIEQELALPERVIYQNEHFVILSPFAARFPFSVEIYPLVHSYDFVLMNDEQYLSLAQTLKFLLTRYRTVLGDPPYNMTLQTAPNTGPRSGHPEYWGSIEYDYHWHLEIMPRLTKMAGFEWGTGFYINPVSPEDAARYLRGETAAQTDTDGGSAQEGGGDE